MFVDVEQNTEAWFELRLGRATSSNFAKVMAGCIKGGSFRADAAFGEPAKKYAQRLALERITGKRKTDTYKNAYMDAGHEWESTAIAAYEIENLVDVTNGGFNHLGWVGDSPDGNTGEHGTIEVKSVISDTQWIRLKRGGYDPAYHWQIHGHLWLGNKQWCDFISYCYSPEFIDSKRLYVYRVHRDEEIITLLIERMNYFQKEILKNMKILEL